MAISASRGPSTPSPRSGTARLHAASVADQHSLGSGASPSRGRSLSSSTRSSGCPGLIASSAVRGPAPRAMGAWRARPTEPDGDRSAPSTVPSFDRWVPRMASAPNLARTSRTALIRVGPSKRADPAHDGDHVGVRRQGEGLAALDDPVARDPPAVPDQRAGGVVAAPGVAARAASGRNSRPRRSRSRRRRRSPSAGTHSHARSPCGPISAPRSPSASRA